MHINRTRAMAEAALLSALSLILLIIGTRASINTIFLTALAAYFIGYTINKYAILYGGIQLAACTLLDLFLNPDKIHWILYLCLGGYIFLSELLFRKVNRVEDLKKKMRRQLLFNWILFNVIYTPIILLFQELLFSGSYPAWLGGESVFGVLVLWILGQIGWVVYDKAYRIFFRTLRERKL